MDFDLRATFLTWTPKTKGEAMLSFYERMLLARAEEALADEMVRKGYERLAHVLLNMEPVDDEPNVVLASELDWR